MFETRFESLKFTCSILISSLRARVVCIDGVMSDFLPTKCGVPQGSMLRSILFTWFINDLPNSVNYVFPLMFAYDDVQLYKLCSAPDVRRCTERISDDLMVVSNWDAANRFKINVGKA